MHATTEKMEKLGNPTFDLNFSSYQETVQQFLTFNFNNFTTIKRVQQFRKWEGLSKTDIPVKIVMENINIVSFFPAS